MADDESRLSSGGALSLPYSEFDGACQQMEKALVEWLEAQKEKDGTAKVGFGAVGGGRVGVGKMEMGGSGWEVGSMGASPYAAPWV